MSMSRELILLIIIGVVCQLIKTSEDEHRLVHYLFSEQGYNPLVRPAQHSNQTVVVSFGLLLVQLIHVKNNLIFFFNLKIVRFICRFMKKNK
jgi:hypothetical protein